MNEYDEEYDEEDDDNHTHTRTNSNSYDPHLQGNLQYNQRQPAEQMMGLNKN